MDEIINLYDSKLNPKQIFASEKLLFLKVLDYILTVVLVLGSFGLGISVAYLIEGLYGKNHIPLFMLVLLSFTFVLYCLLLRIIKFYYQFRDRMILNIPEVNLNFGFHESLRLYQEKVLMNYLRENGEFCVYSIDTYINRIERKMYHERRRKRGQFNFFYFIGCVGLTLGVSEVIRTIAIESQQINEAVRALGSLSAIPLAVGLLMFAVIIKVIDMSIKFMGNGFGEMFTLNDNDNEKVIIELLERVKKQVRNNEELEL